MQKSRRKFFPAALTVAAAILTAGSAQAGLNGSVVNVSPYYPDSGTLYEAGPNTTVSGAIEYPTGSFPTYEKYFQIDITDTQMIIDWTVDSGTTFTSASFNGFDLSIISGPIISSAVEDGASQFNPVGISIVDGNQLFLNYEGVFVPGSSSSIIDINTSPTPEPSTLALAGLGGLSLLGFRRRK